MTRFLGKFETKCNLSQLLMAAFFLLSLTVLVVSSSLQLVAHFQTEKRALYNNQQLIAEGASRAVGGFVQEKCKALTTAAWMTDPDTASVEQWQLVLQRLLGLQAAYRRLAISGLDGQSLAAVARYSPQLAAHPEGGLETLRFARPAAADSGPLISEVYIHPVTCEPLISIQVPVVNALRQLRSILTAEVNLKFMWDVVDRLRVGRTGYTYVVDQYGNMLAFGDTARVLKGENLAHVPTVAEFVRNSIPQASRSVKIYRGINGSLVVGTYVPLETPHWAIVTELPWMEAFREVIQTGLLSLVIIGAMAVIAALLGAAIARRLSVPLVTLQETASRIAQGEGNLQAGVEGPREVAQLAGAFNSMSNQLQQSLNELEMRFREVLRARDALKISEERLRLAQEGTSDGIWDWDVSQNRQYFSPQWYRMLGYEADEFPPSFQHWVALIHDNDRELVEEAIAKAMASHAPFGVDFRMLAKNGSWHWIQSRGKVVDWDADGNALRLAGSHSDITERKEAEKERASLEAKLLQAQKMEAVGHLAGGIAHDFNNMLSVVMGHTELAMLDLDPDDELYDHLGKIHGAARRSEDLVRQLLAFARKQTIRPKVLDINATISGMLTMLRRIIGEDIDLAWKPGRNQGRIKIDPSQMDQILANLMVNARDAIMGVGKVTIETGMAAFDKAYCDSHPGFTPGRFVMLAFSDSGCGMDDKILAKVFDPFFTTKPIGKGTGLGLSTVYGIVKQNEGFVNVYSEPGSGTTFRVYLPVVHSQEIPAVEEKPAAPMPAGSGTVLIVEDDAAILELGQSILEQLGYTVMAAGTPEGAIELAQEHDGRIELLITDVVMPQMNGRELVRRLERIIPGLKCLYMSGYTANVIAHHGVLDPGINFLQKPFSIQEIATRVREVIDQ